MSKLFTTERKIRFSHCDPAGIVYFVNFLDMASGCVEDWFEEAIGFRFYDMHVKQRIGFPVVKTSCEFFRPCHLGDRLVLELMVTRLGRSSIEFSIRGQVAGEEKFQLCHTVVLISLDTLRSLAISDDLRAKIEPYIAA